MLTRHRARFAVTLAGVAVSVALMLFLAGMYGGVRTESNGYVAERPVAVWLAQRNANNLVRSSSFLSTGQTDPVRRAAGVAEVAPLLRLITSFTVGSRSFTAFVCGVDPGSAATRPRIVAGSGTLRRGEIIVDRALARRAGLAIGDTVQLQGRPYRVSGMSAGTNVIISQFTFIALDDARDLIGFRNIVSFLLVTARPGTTPTALAHTLSRSAPDLNVFTAEEFTKNNLAELRSGLLPILATVSVFGVLVGAAVVTLLLSGAILERREDYAVIQAIGASTRYVRRVVLHQALATVTGGYMAGLILFWISRPIIASLVPVFVSSLSPGLAALIGVAALAMGTAGAVVPIAQLQRIHPAEAFRA